jgi:hypothetical protein
MAWGSFLWQGRVLFTACVIVHDSGNSGTPVKHAGGRVARRIVARTETRSSSLRVVFEWCCPPPLCRSPKQGAASQRGDYAMACAAAGRLRAASPSTAVTERSAAAASFAGCIIEDIYYRQSGGAGSGGQPDKAGRIAKSAETGTWGATGELRSIQLSAPVE